MVSNLHELSRASHSTLAGEVTIHFAPGLIASLTDKCPRFALVLTWQV
jgi:hypothetical protein